MKRQVTVTLPDILSAGDVVLYRRILSAEAGADWAMADRLMAALEDRRLVGQVLAIRYLDRRYKSSGRELERWLALYPDMPQADQIYRLAVGAKGVERPTKPLTGAELTGNGDDMRNWGDQPYRPGSDASSFDAEASVVRETLRRGDAVEALRVLQQRSGRVKEQAASDQLRAEIAASFFASGRDDSAFELASTASRSADRVPMAGWIAGLAAWRMGRPGVASVYFERVATSGAASPWTQSAGAFWAWRSHLASGHLVEADHWLGEAADHQYTFYGLLARQRLGSDIGFDWSLPVVHGGEIARLQPFAGVTRALALLQIGDRDAAEAELRHVFCRLPPALAPTVLTIAERGGMPGLAMRLAVQIQQATGMRYDAAFYPEPPWVPPNGFTVNRALLYAFARQESHFTPGAVSSQGAAGLMQLMPSTARAAAGFGDQNAGVRTASARLVDPSVNLDLAQRLIAYLLDQDQVKGNLLDLSIAYNGGMGLLAHYQGKRGHGDDPLLFLEALPSSDQRLYMERVLANFWIYQARLGQKPETLDSIVGGQWPIYTPPSRRIEVAQVNARN